MDPKLVAVVVLLYLCIDGFGAGQPTSGDFNWDGRTCHYSELRQRNSHYRTLLVTCDKNKKRKIGQLKCSYGGDPHTCHWYNQNNQGRFYKCLVDNLKNTGGADLCSPETVSCHHCEGVVFDKTNNIFQELMAKIDERVYAYAQEAYDQDDSSYHDY